MRILHVIYSLDPATGGPPRVATRVATAQSRLGHQVTVVSHGDEPIQMRVADMVSTLKGYEQVKQICLPVMRSIWERLSARQTIEMIRPLVEQADVVHIHNVWEAINRATATLCRKLGKPYYVQPNGMLDLWCMEQKGFKKRIALWMAYRRMLDGATGLCLGNAEEEKGIRALGLKAPAVIVPLNAMFLEELSSLPPVGEGYRLVPPLDGNPYAVFMGRLHYKKGLDYLAEGFALAAKQRPDFHLVVIGHDEGAREDFVRRIAGHRLTDRVHLVGPRHGLEKWAILRDAKMFVLPSRQEGFSIAITEGLASSLPVVVSPECHFDEVAIAGAGLVPPLEPTAIAQAMLDILNDPAKQASMSQAARRLIEEKYNCLSAAGGLVDAYRQAIRSR